jgi:hypothetical protein
MSEPEQIVEEHPQTYHEKYAEGGAPEFPVKAKASVFYADKVLQRSRIFITTTEIGGRGAKKKFGLVKSIDPITGRAIRVAIEARK